MKKRLSVIVAVTVGAAAGGFGLPAQAAEAEDIIKYRQAVMKSVGGHMGAMAQIVRGKVDYAGDLAYHAASVASSMADVPALFPPDSDFGETEALDSVWEKPEEFRQAAQDAKAAADVYLQAVGAGDKQAIGDAFKKLGEACKACHKDFRQEDE